MLEPVTRVYRLGYGKYQIAIERERVLWVIVGSAFPVWVLVWILSSYEPVADRTNLEIDNAFRRFTIVVEQSGDVESYLGHPETPQQVEDLVHLRYLVGQDELAGVLQTCVVASDEPSRHEHIASFLIAYSDRILQADVRLREITEVADLRGGPEALPWRIRSVTLNGSVDRSQWEINGCGDPSVAVNSV